MVPKHREKPREVSQGVICRRIPGKATFDRDLLIQLFKKYKGILCGKFYLYVCCDQFRYLGLLVMRLSMETYITQYFHNVWISGGNNHDNDSQVQQHSSSSDDIIKFVACKADKSVWD